LNTAETSRNIYRNYKNMKVLLLLLTLAASTLSSPLQEPPNVFHITNDDFTAFQQSTGIEWSPSNETIPINPKRLVARDDDEVVVCWHFIGGRGSNKSQFGASVLALRDIEIVKNYKY
jgi:hypothetical protein